MSLLKDWVEDNKDFRFTYKIKALFNVTEWSRLHQRRKQRADRGWSYRDTWGAGEHIAQMTAEMLQCLLDKGHVDWDIWFDMNVKEDTKNSYKNLQEVIDDITAYLEYTKTSWADGLTAVNTTRPYEDDPSVFQIDWADEKTLQRIDDEVVTKIMNKWHKEETRLYKKSVKAMTFFSRHYISFWD